MFLGSFGEGSSNTMWKQVLNQSNTHFPDPWDDWMFTYQNLVDVYGNLVYKSQVNPTIIPWIRHGIFFHGYCLGTSNG